MTGHNYYSEVQGDKMTNSEIIATWLTPPCQLSTAEHMQVTQALELTIRNTVHVKLDD